VIEQTDQFQKIGKAVAQKYEFEKSQKSKKFNFQSKNLI